ncbi:MAG: hypothetical protein ACQR33_06610 [Candidatus Saccharibacteria bacterium]
MVRLPVPGSDDGNWGSILNDFVSVEASSNGILKIRSDGTLANLAHTAGDEVIAGIKTFTASPIVPAPTISSQVANKSYVDAAVAAGNTTIPATTQASNYTFVLADAGTCVEGTSASAQTFTIPPNSTVAFALGTVVEVFQFGSGQITIAAGVGVTLLSDGGKLNTAGQYATISLRQRAINVWVLAGDLA